MQIRSKLSGISFHVQSEVAQELIASGLCEQVVEAKKPATLADFLRGRKPNTRWVVGYTSGAYGKSDSLCIGAKCATCKQGMTWTGTSILKTSSEDCNKFHHCGTSEQIPADVLKRYAKLVPQKGESIPQDSSENPMVRVFRGTRRPDNSDTEYETGDPQPI